AWGKPVVVENVTGAGGNIATDRAAKSPPDGYTLVMGGNASIVFNASLMKLPYDPIGDFAPITQVFIAANVLAIPPEIPAKTIPAKLPYGHAGVGTSQHLGGELFKFITKTDIQPVAYRGSTAIMPDLIAGRVSMCFCNVVNVLPLAREGKLRIFAVTSKKR